LFCLFAAGQISQASSSFSCGDSFRKTDRSVLKFF